MSLIKQLEQLGLTDKEAKVYKALLELGEATAQDLATKSGVNRATTYVALESLIKKGLATSLLKKKKTYFIVETPLQILDLLYKQKEDIESRIGRAKKLMPELEMLERLTKERAKVKFYEGKEGLELIRKDIFRSGLKNFEEIFNINKALDWFPVTPSDHRQFYYKKRIKARMIVVYDPKKPIPKLPMFWQEERRYLPSEKYPFNADLMFYLNKAVLISLKDNLIAVVLENEAIVQALRTLFELAWQGADKYTAIKAQQDKLKKSTK
jgi:predicted DNA-binding transcriptional regulator